jgi:hypothetical protein
LLLQLWQLQLERPLVLFPQLLKLLLLLRRWQGPLLWPPLYPECEDIGRDSRRIAPPQTNDTHSVSPSG